ncbi:MAG TPA: hypothetical protein ACFE0H_06195 [Elainellaceae cyanobacterium]
MLPLKADGNISVLTNLSLRLLVCSIWQSFPKAFRIGEDPQIIQIRLLVAQEYDSWMNLW